MVYGTICPNSSEWRSHSTYEALFYSRNEELFSPKLILTEVIKSDHPLILVVFASDWNWSTLNKPDWILKLILISWIECTLIFFWIFMSMLIVRSLLPRFLFNLFTSLWERTIKEVQKYETETDEVEIETEMCRKKTKMWIKILKSGWHGWKKRRK